MGLKQYHIKDVNIKVVNTFTFIQIHQFIRSLTLTVNEFISRNHRIMVL